MPGRRPAARRRNRRAAAFIALTVVSGGAQAQSFEETPKPVGFPAGPFMIAPSLTTGYAYDSNLFFSDSPNEKADYIASVEPAVNLTLPFSNSSFRLGDTLTWVDYQQTEQNAGKTANDAVAELILRFGSLDQLQLSAHNVNGVAETPVFDPGGEATFQGNAYEYHSELASISREIDGARGYRFSLQRNALHFDPSETVDFSDYRGFDGEGAYLQPLSTNTRLAFGYLGTRYDHFDNLAPDPNAVARTESGNTVYAQIEGRLGPRQPYSARVGWENLSFSGDSKDFSGLIGQARMSAIVGGGVELALRVQRQPYRSFFDQPVFDPPAPFRDNNFYVFDLVGAQVVRRYPQGSVVGGDFDFFQNTYAEPVQPSPGAPAIYRSDRSMRLQAYANLLFRERFGLRLSILKNRRYSNYPGSDYNAIEVFVGFIFGWI